MYPAYIQIYPQGSILIESSADNVRPFKYNRSVLKQKLIESFVSTDEDGTLVWWEWEGNNPVRVRLDFPKDRFSMKFLRHTAQRLQKLFQELHLAKHVETCEMNRIFLVH